MLTKKECFYTEQTHTTPQHKQADREALSSASSFFFSPLRHAMQYNMAALLTTNFEYVQPSSSTLNIFLQAQASARHLHTIMLVVYRVCMMHILECEWNVTRRNFDDETLFA